MQESAHPLPPTDGSAKARYVQSLFGRIVDRYDLLNDLMTLGLHRRWRRLAIQMARPWQALALDVGTGTGDLAGELVRQGARRVIALDFVPAMVWAARTKAQARLSEAGSAGSDSIGWLVSDAQHLPVADQTFDCVTSAFVMRNVADPAVALAEMWRILRPGGRVVCLETTRPRTRLSRLALRLFGVSARLLGRLIAGDAAAYAYLPDSTARFADADDLSRLLAQLGFIEITYTRHGVGLIAIHVGVKP